MAKIAQRFIVFDSAKNLNTMPSKSVHEFLLKLIFVACQYFLSAAEFQKGH
jgi:hypothetical protein